MIKAIIFDLDGVIADSTKAEFEAYRQAFQKHGITLTYNEFLILRGGIGLELIETILKNRKVMLNAKHIYETKQRIYETIIPKIKPFAETIRLINRLKNYKLAVASSSSSKNIQKILQNFRIRSKFDVIVGGEDVKRGKPNPEIFLLTAKKLGVEVENCLVIEDSSVGFEAAKKAGMECIILK